MISFILFSAFLGWTTITAALPVDVDNTSLSSVAVNNTAYQIHERDLNEGGPQVIEVATLQIKSKEGKCLYVEEPKDGNKPPKEIPIKVGDCKAEDGYNWKMLTQQWEGRRPDNNIQLKNDLTEGCITHDMRDGGITYVYPCNARPGTFFFFRGSLNPVAFVDKYISDTCMDIRDNKLAVVSCGSLKEQALFYTSSAPKATTPVAPQPEKTTTPKEEKPKPKTTSSSTSSKSSSTTPRPKPKTTSSSSSSPAAKGTPAKKTSSTSSSTPRAQKASPKSSKPDTVTVTVPQTYEGYVIVTQTTSDIDVASVTKTNVITISSTQKGGNTGKGKRSAGTETESVSLTTATVVTTVTETGMPTTVTETGKPTTVTVESTTTTISSPLSTGQAEQSTSTTATPSSAAPISTTFASTASVSRGGTLNPSAAAEANERDDTATRAFSAVEIRAPDGRCMSVDPFAGDFRQNLIPVSLVNCTGSDNEKWDVITAGKHNDQPGNALIVSSLTNGCISFDSRRASNDTVNLFACGGRADGGGDTNSDQLVPFDGALSFAMAPTGENGQVCFLPGDARLVSGSCPTNGAQLFAIFP